MASVDSPEKNADFARAHGGATVVLSDPTKEAARAYGVLSPSGHAQRHTFYIDSDGLIRYVDRSVAAGTHGAEVASRLAGLGFPPGD